MMQVTSLHVYPIKSCQGIDVQSLAVEEFGPRHDREWLIVDEKGMFQTQRTLPKLAQIKTAISESHLEIAVGSEKLAVALDEFSEDVMSVKVWSSEIVAHVERPQHVHECLSDFLGKKLFLVRFGPLSHREATQKGQGLGAAVRFSDKTALLVTNATSLQDLNGRLKDPVAMNRFRPNVVIGGASAWAEDRWSKFKVGGVELEVASACGRCTMITIDQKSGESPSKEPLTKLGEFRRFGNSIDFGVVAVQRSFGEIRIGDQLLPQ